jgi:hypothetical protein
MREARETEEKGGGFLREIEGKRERWGDRVELAQKEERD